MKRERTEESGRDKENENSLGEQEGKVMIRGGTQKRAKGRLRSKESYKRWREG